MIPAIRDAGVTSSRTRVPVQCAPGILSPEFEWILAMGRTRWIDAFIVSKLSEIDHDIII